MIQDRITYICPACKVTQSTPITKPVNRCQAYWRGKPCRSPLTQVDPKPKVSHA